MHEIIVLLSKVIWRNSLRARDLCKNVSQWTQFLVVIVPTLTVFRRFVAVFRQHVHKIPNCMHTQPSIHFWRWTKTRKEEFWLLIFYLLAKEETFSVCCDTHTFLIFLPFHFAIPSQMYYDVWCTGTCDDSNGKLFDSFRSLKFISIWIYPDHFS